MAEHVQHAPHRTPPVLSVAPMMEYTDRHYRYFMRQITRHTLLYTEMITSGAIIHGHRDHLLDFDPAEHPIALQLGGDDPDELRESVRIAVKYGYDEYNLNVGCPSDRVQNKNFGAALMKNPELVRDLVFAMKSATEKPVTVKHRIGVDGLESHEEMRRFVEIVNEARPARFTVHARIAILSGLSPKENRSIPPLRYDDVYRLTREMPDLEIEINGGIHSLDEAAKHLEHVDSVMIGRAAYDNPWMLHEADSRFFDRRHAATRADVVDAMVPYIREWQSRGWHPRAILRHMLGLFAYQPGARRFRQMLSGPMPAEADGGELLLQAAAAVPRQVRVA